MDTIYYSKVSGTCLFCNKLCEPSSKVLLVETPEKKDELNNNLCTCLEHPDEFLGSLELEEDIDKLRTNVKYAFVLKALLGFPKAKCAEYFQERGDEGWFSVCEGCTPLVNEGHEVFHEISRLETRLLTLKATLKETIITTSKVEDAGAEDEGSIFSEVRRYIARPDEDVDQTIVKQEPDFDIPMDEEEMYDGPSSPVDDAWMACDDERKPARTDKPTGDDLCPRKRSLRIRKPKARSPSPDLSSEESSDEYATRKTKKMKRAISPNYSNSNDNDTGKNKEFSCKICRAKYRNRERLAEHTALHSKASAVRCNKSGCKFVSSTNRAMLTHQKNVHGGRSFKVESQSPPPRPSSNKTKPKNDNEEAAVVSSSEGSFKCSQCPAMYKSPNKAREHAYIHSRNDALKCEVCPFVCLYERGMKIHMTKSHSDRSGTASKNVKTEKEDGKDVIIEEDPEDESLEPYSCTICNATYKTKHRLREHELLHQNKNALICDKCPFVCQSERYLSVHTKRNHGDDDDLGNDVQIKDDGKIRDFVCSECPAKYRKEYDLRLHVKIHRSGSGFKCERCNWVFAAERSLKQHVTNLHRRKHVSKSKIAYKQREENEAPYKCDHCSAEYGTRPRIRDHVYINHQDKFVQCNDCERCFETSQLLDIHIRNNNPCGYGGAVAEQRPFPCHLCTVSFRSRKMLGTHLTNMHKMGNFKCQVCPAVFPTESRCRYHMSRAHDKVHNVCGICGYKSHGAGHLALHMQKHTKEKNFMCEICSKTFTSSTYLACHKTKEHYKELGVQPIKCTLCDMLLPSKSSLKYHTAKVHEKQFRFFCEECGKGFLFDSSLKNHAKVHSTERTEVCQFCGAAYVHTRVLMDHMRRHHPEQYAAQTGKDLDQILTATSSSGLAAMQDGPFACKLCGKEFAMRYHLHTHMKEHTEVFDKYKCDECGKGYSSQAGVRRHKETSHVESVFVCEFCLKDFPCRDYLRYHLKHHCQKKKESMDPVNIVKIADETLTGAVDAGGISSKSNGSDSE